jgi:hypothetical protein
MWKLSWPSMGTIHRINLSLDLYLSFFKCENYQ